jgi:phytoene/squalene synthetase
MQRQEIETFRKAENFPVASFMLPKKSRKSIRSLYKFARYADEIADSEDIPDKERISKLEDLKQAIISNESFKYPDFVSDFIICCNNGEMDKRHAILLLDAFIQDNEKKRYNSWQETLDYCQKSAATIGRLFLEATKEFDCNIKKADNICIILQLLNHLQDLRSDLLENDRLYFDKSFFPNIDEIKSSEETSSIKNGKKNILDKLKTLLDESRDFTAYINSFRVRAELNTIIFVAGRLIGELNKNDILSKRVELSKIQKISCLFKGTLKSFFSLKKSTISSNISKKSKSSFLKPMLQLGAEKADDMLCFYAFCRKVDDAADAKDSAMEKVNYWQNELNKIFYDDPSKYPENSISRQLNLMISKYNIEKKYLQKIISGQKMDLCGEMVFPDMFKYETYCYNVASAVGMVSVQIFGYDQQYKKEIENFAEFLGKYFQTINIMRDIQEDFLRERCYIPSEIWHSKFNEKANLENLKKLFSQQGDDESKDKKFKLYSALAELADQYRNKAFAGLPESQKDNMKVALMMDRIYSSYLERMRKLEFCFNREDLKLSFLEKIYLLKVKPFK